MSLSLEYWAQTSPSLPKYPESLLSKPELFTYKIKAINFKFEPASSFSENKARPSSLSSIHHYPNLGSSILTFVPDELSCQDRPRYKSKLPKLTSPNPTFPAITSAVEVVRNEKVGRHGIAARDIRAGELIAIDDPVRPGFYIATFPDLRTYIQISEYDCSSKPKRSPRGHWS